MKHKHVSLLAGVGLMLGAAAAMADDDGGWSRRGPDVAPVQHAQYQAECGSCHFAYQPGLLPAASWRKLMGSLTDHFGENAELGAQVQGELTAYLEQNAAENSDTRRSAKILASIRGQAPLRITEVPYIRAKHREIPARLLQGNPKVLSLSNCDACHSRAATGSYSEHEVNIPGVGRWDD